MFIVRSAALPLKRFTQLGQGSVAAHTAESGLDVQQRRRQPSLLLIARPPAVDFPRALLNQAEHGLQHVRRGQRLPQRRSDVEAMQGEGLLEPSGRPLGSGNIEGIRRAFGSDDRPYYRARCPT